MEEKNGLYLEPVHANKIFSELPIEPIILNNFRSTTTSMREVIHNMLITTYGKKVMSIDPVPSCYCTNLKGVQLLNQQCDICNQRVLKRHEHGLISYVWFESPDGTETLISPVAWNMLSAPISTGKWDGLLWLLTTKGNLPRDATAKQKAAKALRSGLKRGLHENLANPEKMFEFIISNASPASNGTKPSKRDELAEFIERFKHTFFSTRLALPTRASFIIEKTETTDWANSEPMGLIMEAVSSCLAAANETNPEKATNRSVTACKYLADYYKAMFSVVGKKGKMLRGMHFGGRNNYTIRAVITSMSEPHDYNTMHIPASQAIVALEIQIRNILINKLGFSDTEAVNFIRRNTRKPSAEMMEILEHLVSLTENGKGFPVLATRYPSLDPASTQLFYVNGFTERGIRISNITLKGPNADFDGDEYTLQILTDMEIIRMFKAMSPHFSFINYSKPDSVTANISMPKQIAGIWANYIRTCTLDLGKL